MQLVEPSEIFLLQQRVLICRFFLQLLLYLFP